MEGLRLIVILDSSASFYASNTKFLTGSDRPNMARRGITPMQKLAMAA
jgi:hypothetical protein